MGKDKKLKSFFNDVHRIGHVYSVIALTALVPNHPKAYKDSCHSRTAACLRDHDIKDDMQIVLVGVGNSVSHSILIDNEGSVLYDSLIEGAVISPVYDDEAGKYYCAMHKMVSDLDNKKELNVLHKMPYAEFKQKYMEQIETSKPSSNYSP